MVVEVVFVGYCVDWNVREVVCFFFQGYLVYGFVDHLRGHSTWGYSKEVLEQEARCFEGDLVGIDMIKSSWLAELIIFDKLPGDFGDLSDGGKLEPANFIDKWEVTKVVLV